MHISNVFRIFVLMNEQVTDISQVFNRLTSEMASMREVMDAMHTENVSLRRTVKKLRAENRTLRKQLEKYEGPKKNSNNSSTSLSKEPMEDEDTLTASESFAAIPYASKILLTNL